MSTSFAIELVHGSPFTILRSRPGQAHHSTHARARDLGHVCDDWVYFMGSQHHGVAMELAKCQTDLWGKGEGLRTWTQSTRNQGTVRLHILLH